MELGELLFRTQYSLRVELPIEMQFKAAEDGGKPALVLADPGTLAAVPEFLSLATWYSPVKPVIGCEIIAMGSNIILLAKNREGYMNLVKLVSLAKIGGAGAELPVLGSRMMGKFRKGLICFLYDRDASLDVIDRLMRWFKDDFYRIHRDTGFSSVVEFESFRELFGLDTDGDCGPDMEEIVGKIELYDIFRPVEMPVFPIDTEIDKRILCWIRSDILDAGTYDRYGQVRELHFFVEMCYLCYLAFEGAKKIYGKQLPEDVKARLVEELSIISWRGLPGYFLIIQELVAWSRSQGIEVAPCRWNSKASLVAYCLGITDTDPLREGLKFSAFMRKNGRKMPDINVYLDAQGRWRVIDHLMEKYGAANVGLVVTFKEDTGGDICAKGIHACSVLIGRRRLDDYLPVETWREPVSGKRYLVSQYTSEYAEKTGVLQLDIIGQ